jgi:type IV pilus assembly protein PilB
MSHFCHDRRLIGEILVERGIVTEKELAQALAAQKSAGAGKYLGEILVAQGHVSEMDIVTALVVQCNLPYIAISRHIIDPGVARLIPAAVARRSRLVPLERIGNILSVVMYNPLNDAMRQEIEQLTGCHIATFISTRAEIDEAILRLYPGSQETA